MPTIYSYPYPSSALHTQVKSFLPISPRSRSLSHSFHFYTTALASSPSRKTDPQGFPPQFTSVPSFKISCLCTSPPPRILCWLILPQVSIIHVLSVFCMKQFPPPIMPSLLIRVVSHVNALSLQSISQRPRLSLRLVSTLQRFSGGPAPTAVLVAGVPDGLSPRLEIQSRWAIHCRTSLPANQKYLAIVRASQHIP